MGICKLSKLIISLELMLLALILQRHLRRTSMYILPINAYILPIDAYIPPIDAYIPPIDAYILPMHMTLRTAPS